MEDKQSKIKQLIEQYKKYKELKTRIRKLIKHYKTLAEYGKEKDREKNEEIHEILKNLLEG